MSEAEKNELKRQLLRQSTMMLVSRGNLYSSIVSEHLNAAFRSIDDGTYQNQYQIKLNNIYTLLKALQAQGYSGASDIIAETIQLMIDIIEGNAGD